MRKFKAFTLGEVLVTLAIIGVISAVTIPATMQQSAEKKYAAQAKKALSTLQNAIDLKLTYVPTRPTSHGNNVLAWLMAGSDFGYDTLKAVRQNGRAIQTPDGMVYYNWTSDPSPGSKLGVVATFHIDLNGAEGPTNTTLNDVNSKISNAQWDLRAYDIIRLELTEDGTIVGRPRHWSAVASTSRAERYLNSK